MSTEIPLALKITWTALLAVLVPVYWRRYGLQNFLWFSDLALFATAAALWLENALVASVTFLAVALPELVWNVDFLVGLLRRGRTPVGLAAYMFDASLPKWLRSLSLFHIPLPLILIFLLHRFGYDHRAWGVLIPISSVVLVVTYLVSEPDKNINWVFGPGLRPQQRIPRPLYLVVVMLFFPLVVYLPMHWALAALFD